jgi:hypothetical protein
METAPDPALFVASTVNVYALPLVRPVTVQLMVDVVQVNEPGDEVTVYEMIAAPPVVNGADQETVTEESSLVPMSPVGTPGTVAGETAADESDAAPAPTAFVAETLNV